jgi:Na+/H+ antiporter NhaA
LLGLSCLAISFGVCSLPLITDLATFYLTSLILGIGFAISYNGKQQKKILNKLEK